MDELVLGIDATALITGAALVYAPAGRPPEVVASVSAPSAAESLIASIDKLCARSDARPGKIAAAVGPGSFTGIRASAATVLGLCAVWDAKPAFVPYLLAAMTRMVGQEGVFAPYLAANRNETFCGVYRLRPLHADATLDPRDWAVDELLAPREFPNDSVFDRVRRETGRSSDSPDLRFFEASSGTECAALVALAALEGSLGGESSCGAVILEAGAGEDPSGAGTYSRFLNKGRLT